VRFQAFASKPKGGRGGPGRDKVCGGTDWWAARQEHGRGARARDAWCDGVSHASCSGIGVWGTSATRPSCPGGRRVPDADGATTPRSSTAWQCACALWSAGAVSGCDVAVTHSVYPCLTEICSNISNQTSKILNSKVVEQL
jgi:hypothetical protein